MNPRISRRGVAPLAPLAAIALLHALAARPAHAQTDYYNTDAGRPLQTEDAYAVERRAVEIQAAPLRLERSRNVYAWGLEPELAVGLFARTQVELGVPLVVIDAGAAGRTAGVAGIDASVLYNLNAETRIPALAIAAGVLAPVGSLAHDETYASLKGIATKTLPWARFHLNLQYTFGDAQSDDVVGAGAAELARWTAGLAVDRAFPLESLLLSAEVFTQRSFDADEGLEWNAAAGTRVQLTPRLALDLGGGAHLTGDDQGWFATVGGAYVIGLPWRNR